MWKPIRQFLVIPFILSVNAIDLDINSIDSVRHAASLIAYDTQALYNGNTSEGVLGKWPFPPYFWWESGGAWGSMLQYQLATGDMSYDKVMYEAVVSQLGNNYDFLMEAEVKDTGNDDQIFWVFTAMTAAEYNYTAPPAPAPSWLRVTQNAFEEYVRRWNTTFCNGGLKWQFSDQYVGFNYKQTISNAAFFQLSARLARFTGNDTYMQWAEKIWDWSRGVGFLDGDYHAWDGSDETTNCTNITNFLWSYNAGAYLYGAAILQNATGSDTWAEHTNGLLKSISLFFSPFSNSTNIMYERECEPYDWCNYGEQSMKAYFSRWLAGTSQMAPFTAGPIGTLLRASAVGAAASCVGGSNGRACGGRWYINGFDNWSGLGQQMSALEVVTALLVNQTAPPGSMVPIRASNHTSNSSSDPTTSTKHNTAERFSYNVAIAGLSIALGLLFGIS